MNINKIANIGKVISTAVLALGLSFLSPLASLAQSEDDSSLSATLLLVNLLQETTSYSAEVEQLLLDQDGREMEEMKARLLMAKPARFLWEVSSPYEEIMVTDGSLIWRYEPDLEQVTIQAFDQELDQTPIMLLNSSAQDIATTYIVSSVSMDEGEISRFILKPRNPNSLYERMALTFKAKDLVEMQFEDSRGQQTSLSFTHIERNAPIDDKVFSFSPPAGIEIIDTTLD